MEELKRLSSYVLEEFKKIKVRLPMFELMKIIEIRDTMLGSLSDALVVRSTPQSTMNIQRTSPYNSQPNPTQNTNCGSGCATGVL